MALINKKLVTERETSSYKLDRATIELVKFYSEFIGSPQEHVVNEALRFVFRKDKEFTAWLKAHNNEALVSVPRAKGKTVAVGSNAATVASGNKS